LPVEQAVLTQLVPSSQITTLFAYYNFFGYLSLAGGKFIYVFYESVTKCTVFAGALVGGIISEVEFLLFCVLRVMRGK